MAYRDHALVCPRCEVELVASSGEKWQCRECVGVLAGPDEIPPELASIATPHRRAGAPIGCPACGTAMEQLHIAHIDVERCTRDGYVWFDAGELGYVRAYIAAEM